MKLRLTAAYVRFNDQDKPNRDETTTVQPGSVIDATDAEAERLIGLDAAVVVTGNEDTPAAAESDLDMLEDQIKRMEDEHSDLEKAQAPDTVLTQSAGRIAEQKRAVAKARERAGKPAAKSAARSAAKS